MTASRLRRLRLSVTVPVVVAGLMAAVGTAASVSVLERLRGNQQAELQRLIDGIGGSLSAALGAHVAQHDVWSTYDLIDSVMAGQQQLPPSFVMAIDDSGLILASSRPLDFPVGTAPPADVVGRLALPDIALDDTEAVVGRLIPMVQDGRQVGQLAIAFNTGPFVAERREVLATLIAVNAALTLAMAGLGYAVVCRMVAPAAGFLRRIEDAVGDDLRPVASTDIAAAPREFADLYRRFNAVVAAAREREHLADQLAREEKAALMGRLAAAMAHEVNNPLGGLLNAVDTLDRHGARSDVRDEGIAILRRGLTGIRDVVVGMLVAWRRDDGGAWLTAAAIDDLKALIGPQARRKALGVDWRNGLDRPLALPAGTVRQVALNLLINAANAAPVGGTVSLDCALDGPDLVIAVGDDGPGLPAAWQRFLADAGTSPALPDPGALGLWTVRALVGREGGRIAAEVSTAGTVVTVRFAAREEIRHDAA
ncbi:MAG: HAMP domain-containing histidine kinase [Rhodospirillaceae bacterium]|nr:HAMP domain-containing histidine kinase [Rhodospirillaceae bacterium]